MNNDLKNKPVLTEKEAAIYLNVSHSFLRHSRINGDSKSKAAGPPFVRLGGGRTIRYLLSDLKIYLEQHREGYID